MSSFNSKALPPPTREEVNRRERARSLGCVACMKHGAQDQCGVPEYNHVKSGNLQAGHRHGYILGAWHHRAVPLYGIAGHEMRLRYGPSLAEGSKPFHAAYGSDQELQDCQDDMLGMPRATIARRHRPDGPTSRPSKIYRPPEST